MFLINFLSVIKMGKRERECVSIAGESLVAARYVRVACDASIPKHCVGSSASDYGRPALFCFVHNIINKERSINCIFFRMQL